MTGLAAVAGGWLVVLALAIMWACIALRAGVRGDLRRQLGPGRPRARWRARSASRGQEL